jgi:hypothetical protein
VRLGKRYARRLGGSGGHSVLSSFKDSTKGGTRVNRVPFEKSVISRVLKYTVRYLRSRKGDREIERRERRDNEMKGSTRVAW